MKLIIVEHRAHKLASRLWNDLSVYAFALESDAAFYNFSFFETIPLARFAYMPVAWLADKMTRGKQSLWAYGSPKLLPPSVPASTFQPHGARYFFGWHFRNPEGLLKYRAQLVSKFGPGGREEARIAKMLAPLRGRVLIGVELRLLPYKGFADGEFLVPPARVLGIIKEYLRQKNLQPADAGLVIVADTAPDGSIFKEFPHIVSQEHEKANLHLLAKCTAVIGTNSRYANLAAWFGNAPHVVTAPEPIDWDYYQNKNNYFENKYATYALGFLPPKASAVRP